MKTTQKSSILRGVLSAALLLMFAAGMMIAPKAAFAATTVSNLSDLNNAISGSDTEITLGSDITLSGSDSTNAISRDLTIDLNGHTLDLGSDYLAIKSGNVTIKNGTITSTAAQVVFTKTAALTLDDVDVTYTGSDNQHGVYVRTSSLTITGGSTIAGGVYGVTIMNATTWDGSALDSYSGTVGITMNSGSITGENVGIAGNNRCAADTITINGGTIKANDGVAIYHPQAGTLTLNGGTIEGATGVQMCAGTLSIPTNSTVSITGTGSDERPSQSGYTVIDGAAISLINRSGYQNTPPTATVAGGTFTSNNEAVGAYALSGSTASEWSDAGSSVNVSGGTFSQPVADELLASGLVNTSSNGTTFTPGSKDGMVEGKIEEKLSEGKTATVYFSTKEAASTYTSTHKGTVSTTVLKYTLGFDSQGGSDVDSQTLKVTIGGVQDGEVTAKPGDPTREGYTFAGWYTGTDYATEFEFGKELTGDTTVYAKWKQIYYTANKTTTSTSVSDILDTPVLVSVKNVQNGIKVKWNAVDGATGYRVYRKVVGKEGAKWVAVGKNVKSTKFVDKTAKSGVKYRYTVRAYKGTYKAAKANKYSTTYWSDFEKPGLKIKAAKSGPKVTNPLG